VKEGAKVTRCLECQRGGTGIGLDEEEVELIEIMMIDEEKIVKR